MSYLSFLAGQKYIALSLQKQLLGVPFIGLGANMMRARKTLVSDVSKDGVTIGVNHIPGWSGP